MPKTVKTSKFAVVYSPAYGVPPQPVHFGDDRAVLGKWLEEHRAQYAHGLVSIVDGKDYPHEVET